MSYETANTPERFGNRRIPIWGIALVFLVLAYAIGVVVDSTLPEPEIADSLTPPAPPPGPSAPKQDPRYTPGMVHQLSPLSYSSLLEAVNQPGLTTAQTQALAAQHTGLMVQWSGKVEDVIVVGSIVRVPMVVDGMPLTVEFEGEEVQEAVNLNAGQSIRFQGVVKSFVSLSSFVPVLMYGKIL